MIPCQLWATLIDLNSLTEPAALQPDRQLSYKTVQGQSLKLHIFNPPTKTVEPSAALMAIHGGGWQSGSAQHFFPHCRYFAERGLLAISIDYRLVDRKKGTPSLQDAVDDCADALAYLRQHSKSLNIDPQKIAVIGDSAGGHLAVAMGTIVPKSKQANAIINCNGIMDLRGKWKGIVNKDMSLAEKLSPILNIQATSPPMLHLHSKADTVVSPTQAEFMHLQLKERGIPSTIHWLEDARHAFILLGFSSKPEHIYESINRCDEFLASLSYIKGKPTLKLSPPRTPTPQTLAIHESVENLPLSVSVGTTPNLTFSMQFRLQEHKGHLVSRKSFLGFSKRGFQLGFDRRQKLKLSGFSKHQRLPVQLDLNTWHTMEYTSGSMSKLVINGTEFPLEQIVFAQPQEGRQLIFGEGLVGQIKQLRVAIPEP